MSRLRADAVCIGISPDANRAYTLVVVHPDAHAEWVLHDRVACRAARTWEAWKALPAGMADNVRKTVQAIVASGPSEEPVSIALAGVAGLLPTEEWVEQHRRLPLAGVMVNKRDIY